MPAGEPNPASWCSCWNAPPGVGLITIAVRISATRHGARVAAGSQCCAISTLNRQ